MVNSYAPYLNSVNDVLLLNYKEQILESVRRVVTTPINTDFEDPNFGTNLREYLYNLNEAHTLNNIESSVSNALEQYVKEIPAFSVVAQYYQQNIFNKSIIEIKITIPIFNNDVIRFFVNTALKNVYVN